MRSESIDDRYQLLSGIKRNLFWQKMILTISISVRDLLRNCFEESEKIELAREGVQLMHIISGYCCTQIVLGFDSQNGQQSKSLLRSVQQYRAIESDAVSRAIDECEAIVI